MKKFALLLLTAIISIMNMAAQTDQDYYLDFHGDNQKYWFTWNATMECYTAVSYTHLDVYKRQA